MSNKHLTIGPGGKNCVCCFPSPGSKGRKLEYRRAKRVAEYQAMREGLDDLNYIENEQPEPLGPEWDD